MKILIVTFAAFIAAIVGALIGVHIAHGDKQPKPSATVPWYCQSPENLEKFQEEYPTLGVICP